MEEIMSEDLNRWNKADKNKDSKLSQDEFLSFQHPEHNEQSIEAMAEDLMSQMDDDSDLVNNNSCITTEPFYHHYCWGLRWRNRHMQQASFTPGIVGTMDNWTKF